MTKKFIIIVLFSILTLTIPGHTLGIVIPPDIGTGSQIPATGGLACTGTFTKIICVVKKVSDIINTIQKVTRALDYVPHSFPFGGPILSSERACSFKFDSTTWVGTPLGLGYPVPVPFGPIPISIPLTGRAIEVGPPVPTNTNVCHLGVCQNGIIGPCRVDADCGPSDGKVISFPWISKIYENHTENRAGPWALGLGFSPFPLRDVNDALASIIIWIPPTIANLDCLYGGYAEPTFYGRYGFLGECLDNFRFDCSASGGKDQFGNDIYKVIRLLGTSRENAPASAFPSGFTLPLP